MTTEVLLPKLGFSMNEGTLTEWLAENGSPVVKGQPLFALESDKSTNEVESPASGVLTIIVPPGGVYAVGTVLAMID